MYGDFITLFLSLTSAFLVLLRHTEAGQCGGNIVSGKATPSPQVLRSPNYPNGYFNNELCRWAIQVENPENEVVQFTIQNTYIRETATCGEDYLEVRDGLSAWSRQMRKWCGTLSTEGTVTSTHDGIFVTFKTNGQFTDRGFELKYWSVPKSVIVFETVQPKLINYILYGIFVAIIVSISVTMVFVALAQKRIQKKMAIAKELEQQQRLAVHVEKNGLPPTDHKNGLPPYGNKVVPQGGLDETYGIKDPAVDEKARKRDSANNGSTTKVIQLEPALESGILKETSTTPL